MKLIYLAYGIFSYLFFLGTFLYMGAWMVGVPVIFEGTINGPVQMSAGPAMVVNILLILAFGLQHSVMARPAFKRGFTKIVPDSIERSTYVFISCIAVWILIALWQPIEGTLWNVEGTVLAGAIYAVYCICLMLVVLSTFMINHFDLFGLRQVYLHFRGLEYTYLEFKLPLFYRMVRHPLYVGWIGSFWIVPHMNAGHLLFSFLNTAYILVAIRYEERDLITFHGEKYTSYQANVPMLNPFAAPKKTGKKRRGALASGN